MDTSKTTYLDAVLLRLYLQLQADAHDGSPASLVFCPIAAKRIVRVFLEASLIVEPMLNVCEVYELINGEYRLKGAFDRGKFRLELGECSFEFSFDRLFE